MDYCHQCRRHLNGALACAGCGTPAEELRHLAPPTSFAPPPAAPEFSFELAPAARPVGRSAGRSAARRERRARARRGRTVLLGALGIVLAAGALSLAKLAVEPPQGGRASAVREEAAEATLDPDPPAPSERPSGPASPDPVASESVRPSGTPHPGRGTGRPAPGKGSGSGHASGGGSGTGAGAGPSGGTGASAGPGSGSGPSPRATTGGPVTPPATTAPGGVTPSAGGSTPPSPSAGTPTAPTTPSPEPTCTWFLWWCV
ncbi:hypothetical protein [Streptomyces sp. NPDC090025]|uniref:SCO2400 family protein n=1 Tax=Streptomyces sp. NPDC090025 TaxID=3365922 RepID=UPI003839094E